MPIMAPLSDLLGISRDAAVIAYQTGAGLMDMITPTNGAPGPYEILGALGAAGMGEVYRARDSRLDRQVRSRCSP